MQPTPECEVFKNTVQTKNHDIKPISQTDEGEQMNKQKKQFWIVLTAIAATSCLSIITNNILVTLFIPVVLALLLTMNRKEEVLPPLYFVDENEDSHTKIKQIAIWDRTTVDTPSISYLQQFDFDALYFCTGTGESPDLSLIRPASKAKKINHWEYKTTNITHLKIYLLLTLNHIHKTYGDNVQLHIFTLDEQLVTRFQIQATGYKIANLTFKGADLN